MNKKEKMDKKLPKADRVVDDLEEQIKQELLEYKQAMRNSIAKLVEVAKLEAFKPFALTAIGAIITGANAVLDLERTGTFFDKETASGYAVSAGLAVATALQIKYVRNEFQRVQEEKNQK